MRLGLGFVLFATLLFVSCDENSTSSKSVNPSNPSTSNSTVSTNISSSTAGATVTTVPAARFTITPRKGDIETRYSFDASNSEGNITNYSWDFGDGSSGTGESVQHRFAAKGRYRIRLNVTDGQNSDSETKTIRVRQEIGGGGGSGGTKCDYTDPPRDVWFFRVISNDPASKTIVGEFEQPAGCNDVFYLCGDVRIGGIEPGEREYWIGTICEMWNLGNNRFRIHLVDGRYWVDNGETGTYVWPQYDCNPSVACRDFGY